MISLKKTLEKKVLAILLLSFSYGFSQQSKPSLPKINTKETITCSKGYHIDKQNNDNKMSKAACIDSFAGWTSYSGSALVDQLKTTTDYDNCLRTLFSYGNYGSSLFSNTNIEAVARAMYDISSSHDGTLNSGMLGLVTYLHAATYHEFSQNEINLNEDAKYWYGLAAESFSNNANVWNVTSDALSILDEFLIMCDYDGLRHKTKILDNVKKAMRKLTLENNWESLVNDSQMLTKYATAYNRIFFLMFRGIQPVDVNYEASVNQDPEFLSLLFDLTTDTELQNVSALAFIVDNAIGELTRIASSNVLEPKVEPYIAQVANSYPKNSPNWYKAVDAINKSGNCATYNLCEDMVAVRADIEDTLFPNTWIFDDGKLKVRTPLNYNTVQELYYAAKQVQAQFFRALETDEPVLNDPNPNLNMIVYGTMADYHKWQTLLYGLDTNNGGMYIERDATFYTYQRTAQESTFSLEELFRHEYVHYLQGRYIANGFWGESGIYQNNRLTWFEEGMAEHFAGSTDTQGVRIRESQGSRIRTEGSTSYMTVSEVLSADYNNGFKFYRYGNMLWSYWFNNDITTARQLINLVRADDISGYDAKINQLKANSSLQTNFTNYLNNEVILPSTWWAVDTPWQTDDLFSIGDVADIETEFKAITNIEATASLDASTSIRRFKLTGNLNNGNFDTELNTIITQLKASPTVNNFDYINGYYTNVSGSSATFIISGSLRNASISDTPVPMFENSITSTIVGGSTQFINKSTGYIKSYSWSFPGGTPSTSTLKNPTVTYNTPGEYSATLTAVSGNDQNYSITKNNVIKVYNKSNATYCDATVGTDYTSITRVMLGSLNKESTGFPTNGYSDFTNYTSDVKINQSYPIAIEPELSWAENNIKVWIDWNQNGSFTDLGEEVFSSIGMTHEGSIVVPSTATTGVTRMRVRYAYGSAPQPCGLDGYMGEVEDYSIVVGTEIGNTVIEWTGITNNDFNTASNWNTNKVPTINDDLVIPAGLTNYPIISTPTEVNTINIASGATLIANAALTATVTYSRNLATDNWYLIASPLNNETIENLKASNIFDSGTGSNIGIAPYKNDGSNWNFLTNTSTGSITPGQGYSVKLNAASDLIFKGNINYTSVNYSISKDKNDFNLIGNPYTSYINLGDFFKDNVTETVLTEATIWLWNQNTNNYELKLGGIDANYQIAPGQGFFISAANNTQVTFNKNNQSHQSDTFQKQARTSINLIASENNNIVSTKLYYIDGTTTGFDNGYDGTIFGGINHNYAIYSQLVSNDKAGKYAVQSLPTNTIENTVIPIGLKAKAGKKISFSAKTTNLPKNVMVYLENKTNNTFTNLTKGNYEVTLTKDNIGTGKFFLHTTSKKLDTSIIIPSLNNLNVYKSSKSTLKITGIQSKNVYISIYSLQGKLILSKEVVANNNNATISLPKLAPSVYVIKIASELGELNKKITL
ncbi:collagenase [Tenacibaculum aestuariivivum]|uniref:collagenase n=1 Tax=Tenacibaculum aestuariivivum TaxID=2006131 RepID=UPI003AB7D371